MKSYCKEKKDTDLQHKALYSNLQFSTEEWEEDKIKIYMHTVGLKPCTFNIQIFTITATHRSWHRVSRGKKI